MSTTSTTPTTSLPTKCQICNKQPVTSKLSIFVDKEHADRILADFNQFLNKEINEYNMEMQPPEVPPEVMEQQPTPIPITNETTIELEIHKLVNIERAKIHRVQLQYDHELANIAEKHSVDMQVRNFFAHMNPDGKNSFARAREAGYSYRAYGENIAWYSSTSLSRMSKQEIANKIMYGEKGWWLSQKGHKENLLSASYDREGLGAYIVGTKVVVTQNLARK